MTLFPELNSTELLNLNKKIVLPEYVSNMASYSAKNYQMQVYRKYKVKFG